MRFLLVILLGAWCVSVGWGQSAIAPRDLLDLANPDQVQKQLSIYRGKADFAVDRSGITITIPADESAEDGFNVRPVQGNWDFTNWGHVTVKLTNLGKGRISGQMRVAEDNPKWQEEPWNTETFTVEAGATITKTVIFGYSWDYKSGKKIKTDRIREIVFIFGGNKKEQRILRLEDLKAAGYAGEKPPVDPTKQALEPEKGILFDSAMKFDAARQLESKKGATAEYNASSKSILATFTGKEGQLAIKPAVGFWKLWKYTQIQVTLRNPGQAAQTVMLRASNGGPSTDVQTVTIAPGETVRPVISFIPRKPWEGLRQETYKDIFNDNQPGTGTKFESSRVASVMFSALVEGDEKTAKAQVEILKMEAQNPPAVIPAWLGTRPPMADYKNWKLTLEDNFDGAEVNAKLWNTKSDNGWDKRTWLGPEQLKVADGKLTMTFEKKANQYERPGKEPDHRDFSSGIISSFGKWVQRYGYFEARMKLPTAPGLWPAFWMMPDRGKYKTLPDGTQKQREPWERYDTAFGGMEFDVLEHLTAWGPQRFNVAFHWDGYEKKHRTVGSSNIYMQTDPEGYLTVGLLWLPGKAELYGNGQLIGSWEHDRMCNVPCFMIFYFVSGGWANSALDKEKLPDTFVIDYVRVWQRADLASGLDGWQKQD